MPRTASSTRRHTRRSRPFRIAAALAVLLAVAGYLTVQYVTGNRGGERCTVQSADGSAGRGRTYRMSPEQAANAATISAVGTSRGMPERAVTIALATALQESGLRNIQHGDRDSLGLFQQRPSQGWGTEKQILDPVYSAGEFYQHLAEVPGYSRLPLTVAAQRVQRSGYPQAYAKHEPDAALLAAALTGRTPTALNCTPTRTAVAAADAAKVRAELVRTFGKGVLPAAGAAKDGASAGGAPAAGTVSVPVKSTRTAGDGGTVQRGWELAHWAVAQAEALDIDEVAYAGRVWKAGSGWRTERAESGTAEVRMRLVR
ncbi:hypothetical protein OG930_26865 [Streptomyces sp. NBC_01799]|uniref:hypothetical protein n=1 Tax=Streptomyces sp. NBC_01800 TaxID=2975945 RepID=UPI002DDA34D9|nr:hypothetical protein [Streptomyces sp. NBC_01800]WSA70420.1 hypothetical protein OIE65_27545 [Streptomyces sp. NBC_01800]WSA78916.1 hypothetical protein OG930_26865 [Streptomyces sp. NBC_01799]